MAKHSGKRAKAGLVGKTPPKECEGGGSAKGSPLETLSVPACWQQPNWRREFRRRLLEWFSHHGRDLPWRRTKDPYAVWVSEIMLQQTQTPCVVRYFERFLAAFPTLEALARAEPSEVLRLWEGLGYYRRAVQLHQAAQKIIREWGGQFPPSLEKLLQLPGIGRYTAGAILSIAFDQRQPILEANTRRVWARLLAYSAPTDSTHAERVFWYMAELVLPRRQVGRFNQALMELGSRVCLARQPACSHCPVRRFCLAFHQGLQDRFPSKQSRPRIEFCQEAALIVRGKEQVLLRRIPEGQRWAGLWEFPRFALPSELAQQLTKPQQEPPAAIHHWLRRAMQQMGILVGPIQWLKTLSYAVTRYRVQMECFEAEYRGLEARSAQKEEKLQQQEIGNYQLGWLPPPCHCPGSGWQLGEADFKMRVPVQAASFPIGSDSTEGGSAEPNHSSGLWKWVGLEALDSYPMSSPARKLARLAQERFG